MCYFKEHWCYIFWFITSNAASNGRDIEHVIFMRPCEQIETFDRHIRIGQTFHRRYGIRRALQALSISPSSTEFVHGKSGSTTSMEAVDITSKYENLILAQLSYPRWSNPVVEL